MRIYHSQLNQQLSKPLLHFWLIFGDEPWQKNDALEQIKSVAATQGFSEVIRFSSEDNFDWSEVMEEYQSLSLFASQRILEIDIGAARLDERGTQVLNDIAAIDHPDVMLILHGQKLDAAIPRKKWFKNLDSKGCYIPVYELEGKGLNIWLNQQIKAQRIQLAPQGQAMLADCYAGNLPGLYQELQKLAILYPNRPITPAELESLLIDQAKFTPFQLTDTLLAGNIKQCMHILTQMKHEGVAVGQLIWTLHKELTQLQGMHIRLQQGQSSADIFQHFKVWEKKKPLYQNALNRTSLANIQLARSRLAKVDLLSKTDTELDAFLLLADVCLAIFHGEVLEHYPLESSPVSTVL
ncbi:DNA polymerase III subunit delta [Thalassotalea mangrovi]|uniref:DNA polymerase III subunit delta n=1 Tax=Thalassotalea mangrovi TaxID=2572245 RepID=A0A4U1B1Y6_9GAMM|nr:DNA polymerase III subunit delta [Thalassotalea mangrovi]TKB43442.1 DNA polymerase III subunit delta [Thalassotalea mangrovi]